MNKAIWLTRSQALFEISKAQATTAIDTPWTALRPLSAREIGGFDRFRHVLCIVREKHAMGATRNRRTLKSRSQGREVLAWSRTEKGCEQE